MEGEPDISRSKKGVFMGKQCMTVKCGHQVLRREEKLKCFLCDKKKRKNKKLDNLRGADAS